MKSFIAAAGLALCATASQAITVNEATLGDFGNNETTGAPGTPAQLGNLDLGLNTINGRLNVICPGEPIAGSCEFLDVLDGFEVAVLPGMQVVSATVQLATEGEPPVDFVFSATGVNLSDLEPFGIITQLPFLAETSLLEGLRGPVGPLDPGTFRFVMGYPQFSQDTIAIPPEPGDVDVEPPSALFQTLGTAYGTSYTVRITTASTVAPVPLPASLPLILMGLGGMVALRRKTKA